jgi:DNA mismatch endonuclease, patch repair protein
MPKTRTEFWNGKIINNVQRDNMAVLALVALGYKVIVVWECQLKPTKRQSTLKSVVQQITQGKE